jgi:hypothetical protein
MALYYTKIRNFEGVVKHYEDTKVLVSSKHPRSHDVRPIGDRARKWERIVKVSRNCYALSDGYHRGDPLFSGWPVGGGATGDMCYYAPLVWRKHRDGTTSLRVMNGTGPSDAAFNSRYSFLQRNLPFGLSLVINNGKQYILCNGTKHYLAKNKKALPHEYANKTKNRWDKWKQKHDDNSALVFIQNEDGSWRHDGKSGRSVPVAPRVNKSEKDKYKDAIKKFFEWGMTMTPLLPLEDDEYMQNKMAEINRFFSDRPYIGHKWVYRNPWLPKYAREVLQFEEHPMRLNYWLMFAKTTGDGWYYNREYLIKKIQTKDDLQKVRRQYNYFINNNAGFVTKENDNG